jgi:hypothetical protein
MNEQSTQEPVAKAVMGKREVSCHGPNRKYVDGIVIQQLKEIEPDTFLYTHPAPAVDLTHMVNRFLGWKLPMDFAPDCGISIDTEIAGRNGWPSGTNLLNAEQAKQMFEYVTQVTPAVADFSDAYRGAREDLAIWKKRALEAEELNRKFIADINGQTFMGEPAPAVAQEPVHFRAVLCREQQDQAVGVVPKIVGFVDKKAAEQFILEKRDFQGWKYNLEPLYDEAPAVAQSWELNEETAKFLADLILANDEPTPVTLSVGFIKDDDGKIQHGLRVHESEYPEEGAMLLVESTPSPQKAPAVAQPPAEVVRLTDDSLISIYSTCKAEWKATNKRQRQRIALIFGNAIMDAMQAKAQPAPEQPTEPVLKSTRCHFELDGKMHQTCEVLGDFVPDAGQLLYTTPQPAAEFKGWYCAHCQRGVDGSEVTFNEQHQVCGRVITDDVPPAQPAPDVPPQFTWGNGEPPKWFSEWFIAVLDNGTKAVLRRLPKEFSYDYTTADETYFKAFRIKKWMQFPESEFVDLNALPDVRELVEQVELAKIYLEDGAINTALGIMSTAIAKHGGV